MRPGVTGEEGDLDAGPPGGTRGDHPAGAGEGPKDSTGGVPRPSTPMETTMASHPEGPPPPTTARSDLASGAARDVGQRTAQMPEPPGGLRHHRLAEWHLTPITRGFHHRRATRKARQWERSRVQHGSADPLLVRHPDGTQQDQPKPRNATPWAKRAVPPRPPLIAIDASSGQCDQSSVGRT